MEFQDLKSLFGSVLVTLKATDGLDSGWEGRCVRLFVSDVDKRVNVKRMNADESGTSQMVFAETQTESDYKKLKSAVANQYFCNVLKVSGEEAVLSIVNVPDIYEDAPDIHIGVENDAYEDIKANIEKNYFLNIEGCQYFIKGKNVHSRKDESSFIILNGDKRYYTVVSKRKGDVVFCNDETADERIEVISKDEQVLRDTGSYALTVCKNNLTLENATVAEKQSAEAQAWIRSGLDRYIAIWSLFTEKELEFAKKTVERAGSLRYVYDGRTAEGDYRFAITNSDKVKNFVEELESIDRDGKNIVTEKTISVRGKTRTVNYVFSWKDFSDGILTAKLIAGNESRLVLNDGSFEISIAGYEKQYERRIGAIERIKAGLSAKPGLMRLLNGESVTEPKRKNVKPLSPKVIERFGGHNPNEKQMMAINVALNTPDFAIIQGPPGTGKTKVIEAIRIRMSEESEDKNLAFGKVLLTAYQRDATKAMGRNQDIYGLPIAVYADDITAKTEEIEDWIEEKGNEITQRHGDLYAEWLNNRVGSALDKIEIKFDPNRCLLENTEAVLADLENCICRIAPDVLNDRIEDVRRLIAEAKKRKTSPIHSTLLHKIRNFPSCRESYEDGGIERINGIRVAIEIDCSDNSEALGLLGEILKEYGRDKIEEIDFRTVRKLKNKILKSLTPESDLLPNRKVNEAISNLIQLAREQVNLHEMNDLDSVIANYMEAFMETPERVRQSLKDFQTVIGATHQKAVGTDIINIKKQDLNAIEYDNVIIDEAARSCPPDLLIPMSCAKERIILVGDHKQLPQLISKEVRDSISKEELENKSVLDETVFEHLISIAKKLEERDGICRFVTLDTQYRMPKLLGDYTCKCFYKEDGVVIGTPDEAGYADKFRHQLPGIENKCAVWMDVPITTRDTKEQHGRSGGYRRDAEAERIARHLKLMLDSGKASGLTFGIISFYLEQVKNVREKLKDIGILDNSGSISNEYKDKLKSITVETVDKMQGLEFDIVYLSMTRSTKDFEGRKKNRYGFLESRNRICVAMTRQKRCLIVCGDKEMLKGEEAKDKVPALIEFYDLCKRGGNQVAII